jgi:hypothetical protein
LQSDLPTPTMFASDLTRRLVASCSAVALACALGCIDEAPGSGAEPLGHLGSPASLPERADAPIRLVEEVSGVGVSVSLLGALGAPARRDGGVVRYDGALGPGTSLAIRALAGGFEDLVRLEGAPREPRLVYRVALEGVAGLRVVGSTVELLDEGGAPRLRMAPPFAHDREGRRHLLPVRVDGCAFDASPRPPWGRPVTPAGAVECSLSLDISSLDPASGYPAEIDPVWTTTSSMAAPRSRHTAALLGSGRVLVVGGSEAALVDAEVFDPATGTFAVAGPLDEPRADPAAAALDGGARVLVVGGERPCDGCGALATAEVFDEAMGEFALAGAMSTARVGHAAATLADGRVLVVGGVDGFPGSPHLAASELFDPGSLLFSLGPDLAQPRSSCSVTALPDGTALVAGGTPGAKLTERFDPELDAFAGAGDLAERRADHGAVLLSDGRVLVAGGRAPTGIEPALVTELFDPSLPPERAWSTAGDVQLPHYFATLTALSGGRALIAGGCCETGASELFDPATLAWTATTGLAEPRSGHVAVALSGESVLVAGGLHAAASTASAEVYSLSLLGDPCDDGLACGSGLCVDGVCCDGPCEDRCNGCSAAAKGSGSSGVCGPVEVGLVDPRGVCTLGAGECGQTGTCDQDGRCVLVERGTPCGGSDCPSGEGACTEAGSCECAPPECEPDGRTLAGEDCAPYRCREGACLSECRTSSECVGGFVCNGDGRCTAPPLPPPDLGCACRTSTARRGPGSGPWLACLALILAARRSRRR